MYKHLIEYECPTCNAGYGAYPEKAGTNHNCGFCKTDFTIPVGLAPRLVSVGGTSQEEEQACEETSLVPARRESPRHLPSVREASYPVRDGMVPATRRVKMELPGGGGAFDVEVTQETADSLAKTFLGGLLVAIGVFVAAMIGIRKR